MSPLGAWCMVVVMSLASGEADQGSCTGDSCGASDSAALLQRGFRVVDAIETASDHDDGSSGNDDTMMASDAQGDDGDGDGSSGNGDTDEECSDFTTGSTCRSSGCSWSAAFVGEKKEDGSEVSGYICADEEEVEEEVHDKLMNGTGSLIQMLEDESDITSKGNEERWCRRRRRARRRGVAWSCPYCRRRRAPPPPPAKIEANGCPTGYAPNPNAKCPRKANIATFECCATPWKSTCGQSCAQKSCSSTGAFWIPLNYASNGYTCEVPKPGNPSLYSEEPKGDNAGYDCLCSVGIGYCGMSGTWYGTLAAAQLKCDADAECKYLHDWKSDGNNWRACRKITTPGDGGAGIKKKLPTVAPTPLSPTFDSIDGNGDQQISRDEFQKSIDAGQITAGAPSTGVTVKPAVTVTPSVTATPPVTVKPPVTVTPTVAPSGVPLLTQSQKDAIVQKHNALRAGLGASDMTKMTWDDTLANAAQQYVSGLSLLTQQSNESLQKCPGGHSQNRANSVGENMAWKWSTGFKFTHNTDFTPSVQSWYDEIKDSGPYKTGGVFSGFGQCSGVCGHYTQVVWAAANKIGCGAAFCPHSTGMGGYELVCQYGTSVTGAYGGNMGGATLFTTGTACSKCPSNLQTCSSNLCA